MNVRTTSATQPVRVTVTPRGGPRDGHAPSGTIEFGGLSTVLIAGPCSIESREQLAEAAQAARAGGACFMRGGVFKMRTNPNSFQGLGSKALELAREARSEFALPFVSEVVDVRQIAEMAEVVDMFQVGSRNMYNYALLQELGRTQTPVLLKRGFSATVEEWLLAAEYIARGGNENVVLCERGIRTFETSTRNTLDLNSVAYVKAHSHWPVIVDPSHGTGRPELIAPLSMAAIAAGADGLIIEIHPRPKEAKSDGFQALDIAGYLDAAERIAKVAEAVGRPLARPLALANEPRFASVPGGIGGGR